VWRTASRRRWRPATARAGRSLPAAAQDGGRRGRFGVSWRRRVDLLTVCGVGSRRRLRRRAGYAGPARLAHSCLRPVGGRRVRLPGPPVRATTTQSRQLKVAEHCRSTVRRPTCAQSRSGL
jgi:hypothetical protein